MNWAIVNKKMVRASKPMKMAQKASKKRLKRVRGEAPKARISKVFDYSETPFTALVEERKSQSNDITLTPEQLLAKVELSGLTGLSGNGFSTVEKLKTFYHANKKRSVLIVNGVECDPGLLHDEWILKNRFSSVKKGITLLQDTFGFDEIILASKIPMNVVDPLITFQQVPDRYPMGQEKVLVNSLLGLHLTKQHIPAEQGILVMNVQTVLAMGELIPANEKLSGRYITVADMAMAEAKVVYAQMGTRISAIVKSIYPNVDGKIYVGGGVLSAHEMEEEEALTATTNLIAIGQAPDYEAAPDCKNCGACSSKCPAGVKVHKIVQAVETGRTTELDEFHPQLCIGCAACTYVCRAGKNAQMAIAKANGKI